MNFLPTSEQLELQRGVRELLAARWPLDKLPTGFDPSLWDALTETGVFSLRSELGLGLTDAVLVFEELGRSGVAGPLVGTFLAATHAAQAPQPVTVLDLRDEPLAVVAHLEVAQSVLVVGEGDIRVVPASEVTSTVLPEPVDPLSPLSHVTEPPAGEVVASGDDAARVLVEGAVMTAALQVGISARLTELAVDYAKQREQFGRTIGSFQAVKHICADMFVRTELARVAVHAAAVTCDDDSVGDAARAVAGAKLLADEAATVNSRSCVQVHGGMGFTWEVPVHFFLKRAWLHATEFGSADDHAEALAELL